jgi:putative membrane fusion protein
MRMPQKRPAHRPAIRAVRRRLHSPRPVRGRWRVWLAAGVAACALAGWVYAYRIWPAAAAAAATVALKNGTVEEAVLTDALVIRQEQLVRAPVSGTVIRLVPEGQRVRVGAPVVQIVSGVAAADGAAPAPATQQEPPAAGDLAEAFDQYNVRIYQLARGVNEARGRGDSAEAARLQTELDATARSQWELARQLNGSPGTPPSPAPASEPPPAGAKVAEVPAGMAGMLVYQADGLEEALNPSASAQWKPSWFRTRGVPVLRRTGEGTVTAGDPLFKVVDNLTVGLLLVVPAEAVATLPTDGEVQLRFTGRDGLTSARIARRVQEGSEVLLHLIAPVLPEELAGRRKVQVSLVLAARTGSVVPRSAVDVRGGLQGVWVWEGKEPQFHPAPVIGGNQQEVVLETDLPIGTRVVREAPTDRQ